MKVTMYHKEVPITFDIENRNGTITIWIESNVHDKTGPRSVNVEGHGVDTLSRITKIHYPYSIRINLESNLKSLPVMRKE